MRPRVVVVTLVVGVLVLAAAVGFVFLREGEAKRTGYRGSVPPPGVRLPDFELRSYTGRVVTRDDLAGKVVVVTFLESKCGEACPIIAGQIARTVDRLSGAERAGAAFLAVSTHPVDDTAASVRAFLQKHRVEGKLDYLIGTEQELRPVWERFNILAALDSGDADTHSASVRVFDGNRVWVSTLHAGIDLTPANLAHDITTARTSGRE
jgi:protein SCO1/2